MKNQNQISFLHNPNHNWKSIHARMHSLSRALFIFLLVQFAITASAIVLAWWYMDRRSDVAVVQASDEAEVVDHFDTAAAENFEILSSCLSPIVEWCNLLPEGHPCNQCFQYFGHFVLHFGTVRGTNNTNPPLWRHPNWALDWPQSRNWYWQNWNWN